jgi:hypothetical protein
MKTAGNGRPGGMDRADAVMQAAAWARRERWAPARG